MSGKPPVTADLPQADSVKDNSSSGAASAAGSKNAFSNHKGKLAIGVAATLGIMVFYNWREKRLAKKDPEGHARLQRLKAVVMTDEANAKQNENEKSTKSRLGNNKGQDKDAAIGTSE